MDIAVPFLDARYASGAGVMRECSGRGLSAMYNGFCTFFGSEAQTDSGESVKAFDRAGFIRFISFPLSTRGPTEEYGAVGQSWLTAGGLGLSVAAVRLIGDA